MSLWKAKGGEVLNRELDFRSGHCGRQGGEVQIKSQILDHVIVEGKGGEV